MRALIIGCGYVGLEVGQKLAQLGHEVFGLRRSRSAQIELRAAGIVPLIADITRPATLARLTAAYDWVLNCVSASGGNAADYRLAYLEGTRHLVNWLSPRPPAKFVYISSTSVYGQADGSTVEETSPAEPEHETSKILVRAERLLLAAAQQHHFPAVILRAAGIYGPGRGYWLQQFLQGTARIDDQGQRVLNMIHRADLAGASVAALQHGQPGQLYNAADDEPVTQLALFQWLSRELRRPLPPFAPADAAAARKRGTTNKRVSNRKLKAELGYEFKYPTFREGFTVEIARLTA